MFSKNRIAFGFGFLVVVTMVTLSSSLSTLSSSTLSSPLSIRAVSTFSKRIRTGSRTRTRTNGSRSRKARTAFSSSSRSTSFVRYASSDPSSEAASASASASSIKEQKHKELLSCSKLSLAPMMEYTDRHFRKLVSLISTDTLCYTEMVAANALVHERMDSKKKAMEMNMDMNMDVEGMDMYQRRNIENAKLDMEEYGYDMTYIRRFLGQCNINTKSNTKTNTGTNSIQQKNDYKHKHKHNPTVLQLGGSDPSMLEEATSIVTQVTNRGYCNYTAINLNCGCPSPKVAGRGNFGASLMNDARLVRDIVTSMDAGTGGTTPITVKCRIGTDDLLSTEHGVPFNVANYQCIDEEKEYANLCTFIDTVASSGVVSDFQIHARIAVLNKNYSPSDNRKIPTLKYHYVERLVSDFPELTFSLNGGVTTLQGVVEQLEGCPGMAGVMVGRAWAANPWSFAMADNLLYGHDHGTGTSTSDYDDGGGGATTKPKNRLEVLEQYGKYADEEEEHWDPVKIRRFLIKAITPLFAGEPNGKRYRIALDEIAGLPKKQQRLALQRGGGRGNVEASGVPVSELIMNAAMDHLSEEVLLRSPEESYERLLAASPSSSSSLSSSTKRNSYSGSNSRDQGQSSQVIKDWQDDRKEKEEDSQGVCGAT